VSAPVLDVAGVSKTFGEVRVLDDFALRLAPGEVHGLVGHNGSGKSTFVKILAGYHEPDDDGTWSATLGEAPLALGDAGAARASGLRFVHQDLGLVGELDAVDNLWLDQPWPLRGGRRIDWPRAREVTRAALADLGYAIDVDVPVDLLPAADRTGIALARALTDADATTDAAVATRVLVLDEPTAALPAASVDRLFAAIRRVTERGIAVLYISHHLEELFTICDRLTVIRNGRTVGRFGIDELTHDGLVEVMIGRSVDLSPAGATREPQGDDAVITARDLRTTDLSALSFSVRPGEVVGFAGLAGSGREHLAAALYGAARRSGEIRVDGHVVPPGRPGAAIAAGMGLVPANRVRNGLIGTMNVRENLTISRLSSVLRGLFLSRRRERTETREWLDRLAVEPRAPELDVTKLSGGNQQRVVLGRWLRLAPKVLLLDEPTQGVDIGAIAVIYELIREAAATGMAIVVVSSSADQLVTLCDRVIVLRRGMAPHELSGAALDRDRIDALVLAADGDRALSEA
jgi:ribose transport system ATP-binding protein